MRKIIFCLFLLSFWQANAFEYFESEINYWGKDRPLVQQPEEEQPVKKESAKKPELAQNKFDWKKYMNPENKEFFKEGDYTPPEPFMELAKNPTDENLKNWFSFIELKNKISARLQERMAAFLAKGQIKEPVLHSETVKTVQALPITHALSKNYRLRMYFDSQCPHCKRMFGTLKELQEMGFYVEALQVDSKPVDVGFEIPITQASPDDLKKFSEERVPLTLIADLPKKALLPPVRGYRSTPEILSILEQASKN